MTRVLIYAQTPPPLHGQSVMVQLLVDGLRGAGQIDLTLSLIHISEPTRPY